jgi:hypothetical protein
MEQHTFRGGDGIETVAFVLRLFFGRMFWPLIAVNGLAYLACAYAALS